MTECHLELPYAAIIPYNVQIDDNLSDACKLYYGQIVPFAKKSGYMWATDDQLADMKRVSKRTIERWHNELEAAGHIRRVTQNFPKKDGENFSWVKRRKIYINDGFAVKHPKEEKKPLPPEEIQPADTDKLGGSLDTDKLGGSLDTAKNGGITINSLDEISKQQPRTPSAVVVFPILEKLEIPDSLRIKICNDYTLPEVELAVERCLRWKSRPNDEAGIMTTLTRADSWSDNPTKEEKQEINLNYLKSLNHLDNSNIGFTRVVVANKYIEFVSGMKSVVFCIDDPDFKKSVVEYFEYLKKSYEEHKRSGLFK